MSARKKPTADATPRALGYRMPAEWEPHTATWLAWPHNGHDWPGKGAAIRWVFTEMARHLTRGERLRLIVRHGVEAVEARTCLAAAGVDLGQVDVLEAPTNRSWVRDSLPQFLVPWVAGKAPAKRGWSRRPKPAAVKFRFNGWARYRNHGHDDDTGRRVAREFASRVWEPEDGRLRGASKRLVLEGGSIDVDGEGTLLTTENCLLTGPRARMKLLGRDDIEAVLGEMLGVDKVLWLPDGIAGDDTSGHIDDFARFVAPGRVVVCDEPNRRDPNHRPLAAARERLEAMTDARGRKLEVIPLPMPEPLTYRGERLPASYANFLVTNAAVLVPTFNGARDREALGLLAELFPDRPVVGIHAVDLVLGLGTLHCSSQQEPVG